MSVERITTGLLLASLAALGLGCMGEVGGGNGKGGNQPPGPGGGNPGGGKPGKDKLFSGVNTSTEAMQAVIDGRMEALAGGHFMCGAWALVLIYDYANGRDFANEGMELVYPMFSLFDPPLAGRFLERFKDGVPKMDFRAYSKVHNPKLKRYNFGFAQLLKSDAAR